MTALLVLLGLSAIGNVVLFSWWRDAKDQLRMPTLPPPRSRITRKARKGRRR